jgi:hypothetical protein
MSNITKSLFLFKEYLNDFKLYDLLSKQNIQI